MFFFHFKIKESVGEIIGENYLMKFHFKKFKLYPINVGETPHK